MNDGHRQPRAVSPAFGLVLDPQCMVEDVNLGGAGRGLQQLNDFGIVEPRDRVFVLEICHRRFVADESEAFTVQTRWLRQSAGVSDIDRRQAEFAGSARLA
jgi:hypothetical protein